MRVPKNLTVLILVPVVRPVNAIWQFEGVILALYVILMAILVRLPRAVGFELGPDIKTSSIEKERELEMVNLFHNIMVTGALLAFAKYVAKDKRVVG